MNQLIKKSILQKATEEIARYETQKDEDKAFSQLQEYLEQISVALKTKGIKKLNGQNYELKLI